MFEMPLVIAVTSGKGGVGKSNVALNVGVSLVNSGKKVLLVDADLSLANIHVLLGLEPSRNVKDLLEGRNDVIINHISGIDILPATSGVANLTTLTGVQRLRFIEAVQETMSEYEYVLVDTAAGIGSNVLFFSAASDEILVVINPESTSLADSYALIKVLSTEYQRTSFKVVVNRAPNKEEADKAFKRLLRLCHSFLDVSLGYLGYVQNDDSVFEAGKRSTPLVEAFPSSKASMNYRSVAEKVLDIQPKGLDVLSFSFSRRLEQNLGN